MKKEIKEANKGINRAFAKNRPTKSHELRKVDNSLKNHCCHPDNGGHDYRFYPFDNYGKCKKCPDEILV